MNVIDQATILQFHRDQTLEHGRGSVEALGWKGPASQRLRFDILSEIANLNDCSVLDVGCGHGDLRAHLGAKYPRVRYLGLDHSAAFLEVASERYGDWPDTKFYLGDFSTAALPTADYVLASGALAYRSRDPEFLLAMIGKLFSAARCGLGFNLLRRVDHADGVLAAYESGMIAAHCRHLTPAVVVREGYLPDDFTVFLFREAGERGSYGSGGAGVGGSSASS